jgi:hypothetical protein
MNLTITTKNAQDLKFDEIFAIGEELDNELAAEKEAQEIEEFGNEMFSLMDQSLKPTYNK